MAMAMAIAIGMAMPRARARATARPMAKGDGDGERLKGEKAISKAKGEMANSKGERRKAKGERRRRKPLPGPFRGTLSLLRTLRIPRFILHLEIKGPMVLWNLLKSNRNICI